MPWQWCRREDWHGRTRTDTDRAPSNQSLRPIASAAAFLLGVVCFPELRGGLVGTSAVNPLFLETAAKNVAAPPAVEPVRPARRNGHDPRNRPIIAFGFSSW